MYKSGVLLIRKELAEVGKLVRDAAKVDNESLFWVPKAYFQGLDLKASKCRILPRCSKTELSS